VLEHDDLVGGELDLDLGDQRVRRRGVDAEPAGRREL